MPDNLGNGIFQELLGSPAISSRIAGLTKHNVRKMAIMYKVYSDANQFTGPESAEQLKLWVQSDGNIKTRLSKFGIDVDEFDSYLISDRSGEELEILWGIKSSPMAPPYPVAIDAKPIDGIRLVGMAGGSTLEIDNDEDYEKIKSGKYKAKDAN